MKKFKNIPQLLKNYDHWLVWKYEENPRPGKKPLKVPYYVNGKKRRGVIGGSQDVSRLASYEDAVGAFSAGGYDGIGLAIMPEQNLTVLDIDGCIDEKGKLSEFARQVVDTGAYSEVSPSGRGLRAVFLGAIAPNEKRNFHISNGERVEVYCGKAYTTFTGSALPSPASVVMGEKAPGDIIHMPSKIRNELIEGMGAVNPITAGNSTKTDSSASGLKSLQAVGLPKFTLEQARAILKRLPEDWGTEGNGTWYRVAAALHMQFDGSDEAYAVLDEWSSERSGYDEEGNRRRWDVGFSHDKMDKAQLTTMKSLVYRAMENGCKVSDATLKSWGLRRAKGASSTGVDDEEAEEESVPWSPFDWDTFIYADKRPTGAEPLVKNWIYRRTVVLFSSNGGAGKTYVSLSFCARVAVGLDWFGAEVVRGRVLYVGAEDENTEIAHRLWGICQAYGIDRAELSKWLDLYSLVAVPKKALYVGEDYRGGDFTAQFERLKEVVSSGKYDYIVLDNLSKFYMGNENARAMVDEFVSGLASMASETGAAVLLLGHDSKAGDGYSGSTQWHNAARARWGLSRSSTGAVELKVEKNNYGQTGHGGQFEWDDEIGLMRMNHAFGAPNPRSAQAEFQRTALLEAVLRLYSNGDYTSAGERGPLGALVNSPEVLEMQMDTRTIRDHIKFLLDEGLLVRKTIKDDSRRKKEILAPPPENGDTDHLL